MARRMRRGLIVRGLAAAGIQACALLGVVLVWTALGVLLGVVVGGLLVEFAHVFGLAGDLGTFALAGPLMPVFAGILAYEGLHNARAMLRDGRARLLATVEPVTAADAEPGEPEPERGPDLDVPGDHDRSVDPAESPPPETRRRFAETTRRLAIQADVPRPALGLHPSGAPLCYTVTHGGRPWLVVSRGLLWALSEAELEAVLAHEVAHLANGDHRVMTWAIAPVLVAEELYETVADDDDWARLARGIILTSRLGTGLFSRGRELAADRTAARLTGSPGTLADALERLDESVPSRPPEDLRDRVHTRDALNVLPALDPDRGGDGGLLATHPATERRIQRLRALEREQEAA